MQHLCPPLANLLINTYEKLTELFVDGHVLWSEETLGLPIAMPMYALATIPLVDQLSDIQDVPQMCYADNASSAGSLTSIRKGCDIIKFLGPAYGNHANDCKTWLIAKEQYLSKAKELFNDNGVKITS